MLEMLIRSVHLLTSSQGITCLTLRAGWFQPRELAQTRQLSGRASGIYSEGLGFNPPSGQFTFLWYYFGIACYNTGWHPLVSGKLPGAEGSMVRPALMYQACSPVRTPQREAVRDSNSVTGGEVLKSPARRTSQLNKKSQIFTRCGWRIEAIDF